MANLPVMMFNGIDLSNYIRISNIIRPVGNEREVTVSDSPNFGVSVERVKIGAKKHTIQFDIKDSIANIEQLKHDLASVLNTDEPVMIVYGDEPDKYYLGMVVDDITPDILTRWFQRGEFEILIPDGVYHASVYTSVDISKAVVKENEARVTITNSGSLPALPIFTIRHNDENGYIGIVNENGALEYGDVSEVDGFDKQKSVIMRDYKTGTNIVNGLRDARKNEAILNDTSQKLLGTVSSLNLWGRPHLHLSSRGGTSGVNGGSLTWFIPADTNGEIGSLNDYIYWRQIFWAGSTNQYGFIKVTVSDADGNFLYGIETFKRSNGLGSEYNFLGANDDGGYDVLGRWKFKANDNAKENPFSKDKGFCDMLRRDDVVQVFFQGSYKKIKVPAIEGKKGAKIHVSFGAIGNKPLVTHMYLDSILYRKDYVGYFKEVPNSLNMGSVLTLNTETKTAMLDGKIAAGEVVHTPNWVTIPPGESEMVILWSDWAEQPDISIRYQERGL